MIEGIQKSNREIIKNQIFGVIKISRLEEESIVKGNKTPI
jgi:hypothetical protein